MNKCKGQNSQEKNIERGLNAAIKKNKTAVEKMKATKN